MATDTDIRLRSQLDANQQHREQMCRAILATDPKYKEVRPRHPRGGPDGGRDIEAQFENRCTCFGAVGFANGANDSEDQKKKLKKKFDDDLTSALKANSDLEAFVFLTNVCFTIGEQEEMRLAAKAKGVSHCEIFDRERLRIELDSPSGFFIRFQFLNIPLSEAEQASFLARYGDQVQDVISKGFRGVERSLDRLLFLAEASDTLSSVYVRFTLKEEYLAADIGHFRAFVNLHLKEIKHGIVAVWFGSTDKSARFRDDFDEKGSYGTEPGIGAGIAGGQWEKRLPLDESATEEDSVQVLNAWQPAGWSDGVGQNSVRSIIIKYTHDTDLIRTMPRLALRDLDSSFFLPFLNGSLAKKVQSIQLFANGYELANYGPEDFYVDNTKFDFKIPSNFSDQELSDCWVRIRPKVASMFFLEFNANTPRRLFEHKAVPEMNIDYS